MPKHPRTTRCIPAGASPLSPDGRRAISTTAPPNVKAARKKLFRKSEWVSMEGPFDPPPDLQKPATWIDVTFNTK